MQGGDHPIVHEQSGQAHVLVVEEPYVCKMLAATLPRAGYRVTCVQQLSGVCEMVSSDRPDVVVLDVWLPVDFETGGPNLGYGITLFHWLRENPETAGLPVILTLQQHANMDVFEERVPALPWEWRTYVTKPFHPMEMQHAIEFNLNPPSWYDCQWASPIG